VQGRSLAEALEELLHEISNLHEIRAVQDRLASAAERSNARALHTLLLFAIMMLRIYIPAKN